MTSPTPPQCPVDGSLLWRDTSSTTPQHPERWHWFCVDCKDGYPPTDGEMDSWATSRM